MQGIYIHIPETNDVPREYSVAAILLFLFMVLISLVSVLNLLYFYISTFRSMCAELLLLLYDMAVFCHRPFLPGTSLEPAVIPTAQASSFTLHYFPYYV